MQMELSEEDELFLRYSLEPYPLRSGRTLTVAQEIFNAKHSDCSQIWGLTSANGFIANFFQGVGQKLFDVHSKTHHHSETHSDWAHTTAMQWLNDLNTLTRLLERRHETTKRALTEHQTKVLNSAFESCHGHELFWYCSRSQFHQIYLTYFLTCNLALYMGEPADRGWLVVCRLYSQFYPQNMPEHAAVDSKVYSHLLNQYPALSTEEYEQLDRMLTLKFAQAFARFYHANQVSKHTGIPLNAPRDINQQFAYALNVFTAPHRNLNMKPNTSILRSLAWFPYSACEPHLLELNQTADLE